MKKPKVLKKITKKITNAKILSELPFFSKKSKKLYNIQPSKELPFVPKRPKRSRKLTKHHILKNILPLFDSVGISRRESAFRGYVETYNVEVTE